MRSASLLDSSGKALHTVRPESSEVGMLGRPNWESSVVIEERRRRRAPPARDEGLPRRCKFVG